MDYSNYSRISNDNMSELRQMWGLSDNQSLVQTTMEDGRITTIQDLSALVYTLMQTSMRMMQRERLQELRDMFEGGQVQVLERHPEVDPETGKQHVTLKVHGQAGNEMAARSHAPVTYEGQEVTADVEVDEEVASKVDMLASNLLLDLDLAIQQQDDSTEKPAERSRTTRHTDSSFNRQAIEGSRDMAKGSAEVRNKRSNAQSSELKVEETQVQETRKHRAKVKELDRQADIEKDQVKSLEQNRAKRKMS